MSRAQSQVSGRPYGLATVCRVWRLARSAVYRHLSPPTDTPAKRRGPIGPMSDDDLTTVIRAVLEASPFHGTYCHLHKLALSHDGRTESLENAAL